MMGPSTVLNAPKCGSGAHRPTHLWQNLQSKEELNEAYSNLNDPPHTVDEILDLAGLGSWKMPLGDTANPPPGGRVAQPLVDDRAHPHRGIDPLRAACVLMQEAATLPGRHVLYVDDYEALVFLVGRMLRKQGFRTTTFESGQAALDWLVAHPDEVVDLLVTDQNMPGLSGVEVARAIRRLRPDQRIAIVSGHVSDELLAEAAAAGVNEVLGKQDSMEALGAAIRQLLEA